MNILYVENHAVFAQNVANQFLRRHRVKIVPSVAAALNAIETEIFDLFLVDYDLDDAKGDAFVHTLLNVDKTAIVIAVSAREEGNDALIKAGAVVACNKFSFDEIEFIIERYRKH